MDSAPRARAGVVATTRGAGKDERSDDGRRRAIGRTRTEGWKSSRARVRTMERARWSDAFDVIRVFEGS